MSEEMKKFSELIEKINSFDNIETIKLEIEANNHRYYFERSDKTFNNMAYEVKKKEENYDNGWDKVMNAKW